MIMQFKCYKVYEGYIKFNLAIMIWHNAERQKASFPKESVENADLYKSVLNKLMTTHA